MSYPYHMRLWDKVQRMSAQKKVQAERQAQVLAAMKKPAAKPKQLRLV